ncbi:MAG: hypothetical protein LBL00_08280 [Endomicrobium sp.]|jgi:hypothetical protein|nr:hypothetical protein [Endomicrobium sp.]
MINKKKLKSKLFKFFIALISSFIFAVACYKILLFFGFKPFASLYKMYLYHWHHPLQFIAIPCFVFSALAAVFSDKFKKATIAKQTLIMFLIVFLTILISSPLGGMLWHLHDMIAGHFPKKWLWKIIRYGFREGIQLGWLIMLLSAPYNIIGLVTGFFIMKTISEHPENKEEN